VNTHPRPGGSAPTPPPGRGRGWTSKAKRNLAIFVGGCLILFGGATVLALNDSTDPTAVDTIGPTSFPMTQTSPTPVPSISSIPSPRPEKVPNVVGLRLGNARDTLQRVGNWHVVVDHRQVTEGRSGSVLRQQPAPRLPLRQGGRVTLTVTNLVAPPPTCTPGYSPCLTPASDYDCSGGSGDGPQYTGKVRVTGSDPYGLDADADGYGCE
jgi:PASTA domain